jgi:large subunit ribosomal protein L22
MANNSTKKVKDKKVDSKAKVEKAVKTPAKTPVKSKAVAPKTSEAFIKALRISPLKLRRVTRVITGMPVEKAMMSLSFSKMRIAKDVKALLNSAMANAENNHGMDIDNLVVERIDVGKSFVMKRFQARAKGRGARILKPFSNIRIVLTEKNEE